MAQGRYARPQQESPRGRRPKNSDRRFYLILGSIAAAVAMLTFCTCVLLAQTAAPGPAASSQQPEPDSSEWQTSSEEPLSSEDGFSSAEDGSSAEESGVQSADSAVSGVTAEAFAENPIDAALEQAAGAAANNVQLLNAYETALDAWKNEIAKETVRLKRLLPDSSAFSAEQDAWERQMETEFAASGGEGEGSNAPLERAHAAYDAYRARAEKLYALLITYDPGYQIR
ncbi:MAG: hypothetical protein PUC59_06870 [Firmicutes bacterium]|nr:hypothetical protein [Bacillota bacterium]